MTELSQLLDRFLVELPPELIAGVSVSLALLFFGFGIGLSYGIYMELSEKQRWGRYFENETFFQQLHCSHCALSGGSELPGVVALHAGDADDAARAPHDVGALNVPESAQAC